MKKYKSLGDLLQDYRAYNKLSQVELASKFDVDVRTISRWEKNQTLLNPDKEEEMVDVTFIPYQVIRNLNAPVAIPTFYDFDIRKYSISSVNKDFPDINCIKSHIDTVGTDRLRTIKHDSDIDDIIRCSLIQKHISKPIRKELIRRATELLPQLNLILFDGAGFYSGHSVFFPLSKKSYQEVRSQKIDDDNITKNDFINYKNEIDPVFYAYDINADCNENLYYIIGTILKFFKALPKKNYMYASHTSRYDTFEINKELGVKLVWEDKEFQKRTYSKASPRLYEGSLNKILD